MGEISVIKIVELVTTDQLQICSKNKLASTVNVQTGKNPMPSVDNRVEHFFGILTFEFRVFKSLFSYLFIFLIDLFFTLSWFQ